MRARWLVAPAIASASACSLIYGLHDNVPPLDASTEASTDATPAPINGCPAEAGAHTFCEYFDEAPTWPTGATMLPNATLPASLTDAGCTTSPHCLTYFGTEGTASRAVATPGGVTKITYDFYARFVIEAGVTPRVAWISFTAGATVYEFGITFAHYIPTGDFQLFYFATPSTDAGYKALVPFSEGNEYHLTLTVTMMADGGSVSLKSESPPNESSQTFGELAVPPFDPTTIAQVSVIAGVGTGNNHTGATVDTITFDLE